MKQSNVQLSLFPNQGTSVKDTQNGSVPVAKLSTYLKTREALWRMIALFPGDMPVEEAIRLAPYYLTLQKEGFIAKCYGYRDGSYRPGDFVMYRKEVAV